MTTEIGVEGIVPDFTLGDRLRKARNHAGLTVAALAERSGVSEKTINNYEAERVSPRRPSLIAWALATGVSLKWLETGESDRPTPPGPGGGQPTPELEALTRAKRDRSRTTQGRGTTAGYLPAVA